VTDGARTRVAVTTGVAAVVLLLAPPALKAALGIPLVWVDLALGIVATIGGCAMAAVGALVAARTRNPIGWLLLAIPLGTGVSQVAQTLAEYGAPRHAGYAQSMHWLSQWPFFVSLILLVAIFFLYPTGTIPSPRWRWVWRAYVTAGVVTVIGFAVNPYREDIGGVVVTNPFGVEAIRGPLGVVLAISGIVVVLSSFASFTSLVARYRGVGGEGRQQLRWLFAVAAVGAALFVTMIVTVSLFGDRTAFDDVAMMLLVTDVVVGIPVATAVAILKYRLYDLDVVVKKTVVFGLVAAFIAVVYAAIVVGIGALVGSQGSGVLSFAAAAALAVLFQPARDRARRLADRLVYGTRATPYEVLADFSERVGEAYVADDVLPRMARVLAEGTGAESATVWLHVGNRMRPEATFPQDAESAAELPVDAVEVRHRGEVLGALSVRMPASDPMTVTRAKLVADLAAQAGFVLRNVRLIEELRASRQRIVTAQDEERRKLERNIHDGAQQQLVALSVKLRLADAMAERDVAKTRELLADLQREAQEALEDLRDLARGIYPPLLADRGLTAALEAQARKAAMPVTVRAEGIGRYGQEVEAAVYFCSLEALNNVAKYAGASAAEVRLAQEDGHLSFNVRDDGAGFDPAVTGYGTGLHGMADRLDAIGGDLEVESAPGHGTVIRGRVPVGAAKEGA
jgi:signal transduction histidine kinase